VITVLLEQFIEFTPGHSKALYWYSKHILVSAMDVVQNCLSLALVPYLVPAFLVLRFIWSSIHTNISITLKENI